MGISDKSELDLRDLLLQEFQEAWNHYRHLENERSWSLGFLITITIASIGFMANILGEPKCKESANIHFASMLVMVAVCALGIATYARVNKTRFALRHYIKVWCFVRMQFYGKKYEELNRELNVWDNRSIQAYLPSDTAIINWMILALIICSLLYLILGVIAGWPYLMLVPRVVIAILSLLLLLFGVVVFFHVRSAKAMKDPYDVEHGAT